ncbi:hypothetical protein FUT87_16665 [Mitsuaria sp. TWR114]|uniref:hypothetical protein n=1 Tax=Mitsuaria sp. TWR114 TaxID=2601731 RepID=UPI0011BF7E14|nr:hypothetical protein [Mitsuaria sp. TWR114]TXD83403.1 hypothetical protein FUT87_16665 [Mitsuaria sp. TWR114]
MGDEATLLRRIKQHGHRRGGQVIGLAVGVLAHAHRPRRQPEAARPGLFLRDHVADQAHRTAVGGAQRVRQFQARGADRRLEELGELEIGHLGRRGHRRGGVPGGGFGSGRRHRGHDEQGRTKRREDAGGTPGKPRTCGEFDAHGPRFFRRRVTVP